MINKMIELNGKKFESTLPDWILQNIEDGIMTRVWVKGEDGNLDTEHAIFQSCKEATMNTRTDTDTIELETNFPKYTQLPVQIQAVQLNWRNWGSVCDFLDGKINKDNPGRYTSLCTNSCGESAPFIELTIPALKGEHLVIHGDYIIKNKEGEFSSCKPKRFAELYENVKGQ